MITRMMMTVIKVLKMILDSDVDASDIDVLAVMIMIVLMMCRVVEPLPPLSEHQTYSIISLYKKVSCITITISHLHSLVNFQGVFLKTPSKFVWYKMVIYSLFS